MGSGSSKPGNSYLSNQRVVSSANGVNAKTPKETISNNNDTVNEDTGSSTDMQISKSPTSMDDILQHHPMRHRFNTPYMKKTLLPRLTELVKKAKKSCLKNATIQSEYCQQLQEIDNLIRYETDSDGNILEEKQERPAVVVDRLSEVVDKLGLIWTLAKALKVLKKHRSRETEGTEKAVRKWSALLCTLNADMCNTYKKSGIVDMVVEDLQNPTVCEHYIGPENALNMSIMVSSIMILDICAMHGVIDQEQKSKISAIIYPYARCVVQTVHIHAILCLCQLQSEDGSDLFLEDDYLVTTLFDAIKKAISSQDHCYAEVHLRFLLQGLAQLSSKDSNHSILLSNGVIDLLKSVLKNGDIKENKVAVNAIWSMSFDSTVKNIMREDTEMMTLLAEQSSCNMPSISNAADAVRKHVDDKFADENKLKVDNGGETPPNKEVTGDKTDKQIKHIMISYQWDTQDILLRVRDKLKESGYVVWMDVDNIEGSTLQSMAEAVENAAVVLICYSHRYKSSPNARTEAEYAFQLRRDIVPLKMEAGYQADGWLGAIIGTKLYIEVDPEGSDFDNSMHKLTKELGFRGHGDDFTDTVVPKKEDLTYSDKTGKAVSNWNHQDVIEWANKNGIKSRKVANMVGDDLLFLRNLRKEAPEYFYSSLESKLGITSLNQIRMFTSALKNI